MKDVVRTSTVFSCPYKYGQEFLRKLRDFFPAGEKICVIFLLLTRRGGKFSRKEREERKEKKWDAEEAEKDGSRRVKILGKRGRKKKSLIWGNPFLSAVTASYSLAWDAEKTEIN